MGVSTWTKDTARRKARRSQFEGGGTEADDGHTISRLGGPLLAFCKRRIVFGGGTRPELDPFRGPDAGCIGLDAVVAFRTGIVALDKISRRVIPRK